MLAKRKTVTPEKDETEEKVSWRQSSLTIGDKIRLAVIAVTLFFSVVGMGGGVIGVMLSFWNDTSIRLSLLEQRVKALEDPPIQAKPDAVARKE